MSGIAKVRRERSGPIDDFGLGSWRALSTHLRGTGQALFSTFDYCHLAQLPANFCSPTPQRRVNVPNRLLLSYQSADISS
jgi:hypothetical protein